MKYLINCCFCLLIVLSACKNRDAFKVQESKIDSLETVLAQTEKAMEVDSSELRKRAEKINVSLKAIKLYYEDTIHADLSFKLDDYKAMEKIYRFYLGNMKALHQETKALKGQLKTLRNSLVDEKFPLDKFEEYYAIEKKDVEDHYLNTTNITDRIRMVDSTFLRISPEIEAISSKIIPPEN